MAWQPRGHWDWLVAETDLSPPERAFAITHSCMVCGDWLVQRVEGIPASIRANRDANNPDGGLQIEAADPDSALLGWSYAGGLISIRCECGWPNELHAPADW